MPTCPPAIRHRASTHTRCSSLGRSLTFTLSPSISRSQASPPSSICKSTRDVPVGLLALLDSPMEGVGWCGHQLRLLDGDPAQLRMRRPVPPVYLAWCAGERSSVFKRIVPCQCNIKSLMSGSSGVSRADECTGAALRFTHETDVLKI